MDMSAFDASSEDGAARLPISRHPAFRAIVGLSLACLLGLGSLVLPAAVLERIIAATGAAVLIPAAAPPLGLPARVVIAGAVALAGALAGVAIARRLVRMADGEAPARGMRRPIQAREELGAVSFAEGFGLPVGPRSMLADGESGVPGERLSMAPLAGAPDGDDDPAIAELGHVADQAAEPIEPPQQPSPAPLPFSAPSLARRTAAGLQAGTSEVSSGVPFGEPDVIRLVQRLRASIDRRRARLDGAVPASAATLPAPSDVAPALAEEAAQGIAAYFGKPALVMTRSRRGAAVATPAPSAARAPRDQAETDAALRAALVTLQRLSGTV
jgi:hypothetical protein